MVEDLQRNVLFKAYLPKPVRKPLLWILEHAENAAAERMSGLVAATPALGDRFRVIHGNTIVVNNFVIVDEFTSSTCVDWKRSDPAVTYFGGISEQRAFPAISTALHLLPHPLSPT